MALFDFLKKSKNDAVSEGYRTENAPLTDAYAYPKDPYEYFEKLFEVYFPQYTVRKDVRLHLKLDIFATVPYVLYRGDCPVVGIILCSTHDYGLDPVYDDVDVLNQIAACEKYGFQAQRYFIQFRNKASYVVDRMSKAIAEAKPITISDPAPAPTPAPAPVPVPAPAPAPAPKSGSWTCKCGSVNDSRFCPNCGTPLAWKCSCGRSNDGRFCPDCGTRNPNIRFG